MTDPRLTLSPFATWAFIVGAFVVVYYCVQAARWRIDPRYRAQRLMRKWRRWELP